MFKTNIARLSAIYLSVYIERSLSIKAQILSFSLPTCQRAIIRQKKNCRNAPQILVEWMFQSVRFPAQYARVIFSRTRLLQGIKFLIFSKFIYWHPVFI